MGHVLALVPARGGSKGIPDKNIRPLLGHTLLHYAAQAAVASGVIDRMVLSTDSERVADEGRRSGLEVPFLRPGELAQDDLLDELAGQLKSYSLPTLLTEAVENMETGLAQVGGEGKSLHGVLHYFEQHLVNPLVSSDTSDLWM